jgi:hypothetical protein
MRPQTLGNRKNEQKKNKSAESCHLVCTRLNPFHNSQNKSPHLFLIYASSLLTTVVKDFSFGPAAQANHPRLCETVLLPGPVPEPVPEPVPAPGMVVAAEALAGGDRRQADFLFVEAVEAGTLPSEADGLLDAPRSWGFDTQSA